MKTKKTTAALLFAAITMMSAMPADQVITKEDGMDVVNNIAEVKTGANDKPVNDVILESVEIYAYE